MSLTLSCPDRTGIVARAGFLFERDANILDAQQYDDLETGRFFMRVVFAPGDGDADALNRAFSDLATEFAMAWTVPNKAAVARLVHRRQRFDTRRQSAPGRRIKVELSPAGGMLARRHEHRAPVREG